MGNIPNSNNMHTADSKNQQPVFSVFKGEINGRVELKDHVFISKDCTYQLSQYIVPENWGRDNVLLYKYLDYIYRCQSFNDQILEINHFDTQNSRKIYFLIFHTGLQRRCDGQYLFLILVPNSINKTHKNKQKFRVNFGNIQDSFLTQKEVLNKFKESNIPFNHH